MKELILIGPATQRLLKKILYADQRVVDKIPRHPLPEWFVKGFSPVRERTEAEKRARCRVKVRG